VSELDNGKQGLGGKKFDNGKPDLSLVPHSATSVEAQVFGFGAVKYGRDNYKEGMESHRLVAACLRHIGAWQEGESLDPESGLSHLGHARCCLAMLIELDRLGTLKDTRYVPASPLVQPPGLQVSIGGDTFNSAVSMPSFKEQQAIEAQREFQRIRGGG
jgi:hypothetical protein